MTTISRFARQNKADLRALTVVLWENLVLVVVPRYLSDNIEHIQKRALRIILPDLKSSQGSPLLIP